MRLPGRRMTRLRDALDAATAVPPFRTHMVVAQDAGRFLGSDLGQYRDVVEDTCDAVDEGGEAAASHEGSWVSRWDT